MKKVLSAITIALMAVWMTPGIAFAKPESKVEKKSYSLGMQLGQSFLGSEDEVDLDFLRRGIQTGFDGSQPTGLDNADALQRGSFGFGMQFGKTLVRSGEDFDVGMVSDGIADVYGGKPTQMTSEEADLVLREAEVELRARKSAEAAEKLEAARSFMSKNSARKGVVATGSGLQYEVLRGGEGSKPVSSDKVTVHYRGKLVDGTQFDSSYDRGEPTTFPLNQVIPGWTEGLQLMAVGSKYKFFIPPELAYGARGAGADIGPNEALIFEVELLDVQTN